MRHFPAFGLVWLCLQPYERGSLPEITETLRSEAALSKETVIGNEAMMHDLSLGFNIKMLVD